MEITITGRHLEVTPSLKEYVQKKTEKIKYYFEHIINVNVILEVRKLFHIAEVTVVSDERKFFCEVKSNDMYGSI
ncbi:MAG: ribosome-associated translation inhibitor RaiA, partial [Spirochaetota bacterium]|nr:ribosome-associated translation inhibitor RaiA [Spirochaetota bacterium]